MEKREKILSKFSQPKMFNRFVAAAVDAACFVLVAFGASTLTSFVVGATDTKLSDSNALIANHIESSNLSKIDEKNGYLKYETNELFELKIYLSLIVILVIAHIYYMNQGGENSFIYFEF